MPCSHGSDRDLDTEHSESPRTSPKKTTQFAQTLVDQRGDTA